MDKKIAKLLKEFNVLLNLSQSKIIHFVFTLYVISVFWIALHHEPWFDEAQGWLLARDHSIWDLITVQARYEGSPLLWHLLLKFLITLGWNYHNISLISASFATIGAWFVLYRSPFPLFYRILLPFTYFLFYQYSVIARSYCLLAPLLFYIASIDNWRDHPWRFMAAILLLANVSFHGYLITVGILLAYLIELYRSQALFSDIRQVIVGYGVFAMVTIGLFFMLRTPDDYSFPAQGYAWQFIPQILNATINGSLAENLWITPVAAFSALAFTYRYGTFAYGLWTIGLLCLFFAARYVNVWHQGSIWLCFNFCLWRAYSRYNKENPTNFEILPILSENHSYWAINLAMGLVLLNQVSWSYRTSIFDLYNDYCGSQKLSHYIYSNNLQNRTFMGIGSRPIALLPYFDRNLFVNHNNGHLPATWSWSSNRLYSEDQATINRLNPEFLIFGIYETGDVPRATIAGYDFIKRFSGTLFWKNTELEGNSFDLFKLHESLPFGVPNDQKRLNY